MENDSAALHRLITTALIFNNKYILATTYLCFPISISKIDVCASCSYYQVTDQGLEETKGPKFEINEKI